MFTTATNVNNTEMEDDQHLKQQQENSNTSEYIKELLREKASLSLELQPNAIRLLEQELKKAQSFLGKGFYRPEPKYVDVVKEKPIKLVTKVIVPINDHPKFNFVGKLLGPKGNSLKRLQEETLTKIAILGRGSMRDKAKEEELRNSEDPKYSHLCDELHVDIQSLAPPAEAYARVAYALAETRKYLVPDMNDEIRREQFREIQQYGAVAAAAAAGGVAGTQVPGAKGAVPPMPADTSFAAAAGPRGLSATAMRGPFPGSTPSSVGPGLRAPYRPPRGMMPTQLRPGQPSAQTAKVYGILDRARASMDETSGADYSNGAYYDQSGGGSYSAGRTDSNYYETYEGKKQSANGDGAWIASGGSELGVPPPATPAPVGFGKPAGGSSSYFGSRPAPYTRPPTK